MYEITFLPIQTINDINVLGLQFDVISTLVRAMIVMSVVESVAGTSSDIRGRCIQCIHRHLWHLWRLIHR